MALSPEDEKLLSEAEKEYDAAHPAALLPPPSRLPKGGEPVFGQAPSGLKKGQTGPPRPMGWAEQLQAYPGWTGTVARAVIPQTPTELIGDILGGALFGPAEKPLAGATLKGGRALLQAARNLPAAGKVAIGAGAGSLSDYVQGKSPAAGALKGGGQMVGGKIGEEVGYRLAQRRFAKVAGLEDPPSVADRIAKNAPWLAKIVNKPAELWNHLDFQRLFQRRSSEQAVGDEFRRGLNKIQAQAVKLTGGTPRFQSNAMDELDPDNAGNMRTLKEALDKIMDLRAGGYVRGVEAKGGMSAARLRKVRNDLVDETEGFLNRISNGTLGAEYGGLRKQLGKSMAFMRLFNAKDIVKGGNINMETLEDRWANQKQLHLDIENWLDKPEDFQELESAIFRGGDPTTRDFPGTPDGMHVYATAAMKPHGYFRLGKGARYAGVEGSQFSGIATGPRVLGIPVPIAGAYPAGRGIGGLTGEWLQRGPVLTPDEQEQQGGVSAGGDATPGVMRTVRSTPGLENASDEEIQQELQNYQRQQQGR